MTAASLQDLARTINLRDLGGIAADRGRKVRYGRFFRSAALGELAPAERTALSRLGVHTVIDLRYNSERAAKPTPWSDLGCHSYWAMDYEPAASGDLSDLLSDPAMTREAAHRMMVRVYEDLPFRHVEALQHLFRTVIRGEGPILVHCTSGKDRTGMSAALILASAGVPREAIDADYLASLNFDVLASPAFRALAPERRHTLEPIYRVNAAYLDAMFAAIAARDGSVQGFLRNTLGLRADDLAKLRETVLD